MMIAGSRPGGVWQGLWRPLALLLCWLLLVFPLARAQLAELAVVKHMPEQALIFDSGHARALAGSAVAFQLKGDPKQAIVYAKRALAREPMNVVAARTLGLALEQTGHQTSANQIMFLAGQLGWRDVPLQLWLIKGYALKNEIRESLQRANALARTDHLPEVTFPVFLGSIVDDRLREALAQQMADRPLWRGNFFYRILQLPAEQMPYVAALVADLANVGSPITPAERAIYLTRLVQLGYAQDAYAFWLRDQRGQGRASMPWDGGFEHVSAPGALTAPFQWQLTAESVGIAAVVPRGTGHQLVVTPGRDYNGHLVMQTVVMTPGRYRITANVQGDATGSGLHWSIRCVVGENELAIDTGRTGESFVPASFVVPGGGCPAQTLALDIASGDATGDTGNVTIDDVRIQRIG